MRLIGLGLVIAGGVGIAMAAQSHARAESDWFVGLIMAPIFIGIGLYLALGKSEAH